MRKKLLAGVIGGVCMLGAMQAHAGSAGDRIGRELTVEVNVPDETFWVAIQGMSWPQPHEKVSVDYDRVSRTFRPWEKRLQIFNSNAGLKVKAQLQNEAKVSRPDGSKEIPLTVKIGTDVIDTTAKEVHGQAASPSLKDFSIQAVKVSPDAGTYEGTVTLIFELTT